MARSHVQSVRAAYRPVDTSATLPLLTPESPLRDYLSHAVLRHPEVEERYEEWVASVERITAERSLPDPVLTLGFDLQQGLAEDVAGVLASVMGGLAIDLPGPGKLKVRADVAAAGSDAKFAEFQLAAVSTALAARKTYYDLYLVRERVRLTSENLGFLKDMETSVRTRAEAGLAPLQDVLQAESERARTETDLANLQDQQVALGEVWETVLGIGPGSAPAPVPSQFEFVTTSTVVNAKLEEALAHSPRLRSLGAKIREAESAVALAYREKVPDYSLGFEGEAAFGGGGVTPGSATAKPRLGIKVPIWRDRIAADIAAAEADRQARRAALSAEQLALVREFSEKAFGLREVTRNIDVLETRLIPHQVEILELADRGYQGNTVSFQELLQMRRRLVEMQQAHAEGLATREVLAGELSLEILGRPPAGVAPATMAAP